MQACGPHACARPLLPSPTHSIYVLLLARHPLAQADNLPPATYMQAQPDINEKMRAILVDWLVDVHLKFKLRAPTLFLAVNLIDRYLARKVVMRQQLQLVGVSAMLLASKYEEVYAPEVGALHWLTLQQHRRIQQFAAATAGPTCSFVSCAFVHRSVAAGVGRGDVW